MFQCDLSFFSLLNKFTNVQRVDTNSVGKTAGKRNKRGAKNH